MVNPMLNLFIYTARHKDMKQAIKYTLMVHCRFEQVRPADPARHHSALRDTGRPRILAQHTQMKILYGNLIAISEQGDAVTGCDCVRTSSNAKGTMYLIMVLSWAPKYQQHY